MDTGLLATPRAPCTHGLGVFETTQKVGVDKLINKWNILETHTAKHSIGVFEKHILKN